MEDSSRRRVEVEVIDQNSFLFEVNQHIKKCPYLNVEFHTKMSLLTLH